MKRLFLLLTLLIYTLPCFASIGDCDAAIRAAGIPIDGVSGNGPTDPNLRVDCSQCTQAQAAQALQMAQTASNWTHITRNFVGFVQAVRTEPTFNAQIRNNLGKLIGLVGADYNNPQLAQQDWGDTKANPDNATWLTPAVISKVESFAAANNIPILTTIP